MAPLDGIVAATVPRFGVVVGQVWSEMDVSWHATVLQHSVTTWYETLFSATNEEEWERTKSLPLLLTS